VLVYSLGLARPVVQGLSLVLASAANICHIRYRDSRYFAAGAAACCLQVLASESSDSALAELQNFDADIDKLATKQLRAPLPRVGSRPIPPPAAAASQAAAGGGAAARAPTSSASASADAAAISAGLSAALASARQQLQGAPGSAASEQQPQQPARTELDVSLGQGGCIACLYFCCYDIGYETGCVC